MKFFPQGVKIYEAVIAHMQSYEVYVDTDSYMEF